MGFAWWKHVETMAGAIITEDWVTNAVLIYAFDCEKSQYTCGATSGTTGYWVIGDE